MTALLLKCCFLVTFVSRSVLGFNLETKGLTVLSGEARSYFGFTVGFAVRQPDVWALVGAPKGTDKDTNVKSGCLNYCAKGQTSCSKVSLKDARNPSNNQPLPSTQKPENMWLGASLDIGNAVGVCGSRWINALSDDVYVMNGMCYEIPLEFLKNPIFVTPTILPGLYTRPESEQITSPDPSKFNQTLRYGVSTSGISIKYDGNEVVIGSPGINEFAGGIVRVQGTQANVVDQQTTEAMQGQMYGYSVAVGQFYGNETVYYAVGGPRDGGTGKVVIYSKKNMIKQTLMGMEAGSYFGAAICFIPKSDSATARLVVGAPMYSKMMGYADYYASNQEQGKAYVYKNDPNTGNLMLMTKLEGRKSKMSRFGAAMANLNDLNKDGYNDLVVGAPFQDDSGAIYIYMGYKNGFYETQMITAAELMKIDSTLSNLVTFGSSLSQQQTDFNGDQHADVVIGAYGSDKAIVMYTNPPITMKVKVEPDLMTDAKGHTVIPLGKRNFTMRVCFDYEGDNIPADVDVVYELKADTAFQTTAGSLGRVCFQSDDGKSCGETATEENFRIFKAQSDYLCGKTFTVVLRDQWDNMRDLFTPVEFEMKYNVTGTSTDECTTTCPVINQFKPDNDDPFSEVYKVEMELAKAGCDKDNDNECQSNLRLMVTKFRFSEQTDYLVTGTSASFSMDVTVINGNEPSYNTQIEFKFHSNVSFSELINLDDGDFLVSCVTGVGGVACTGYNPSQGFTENNKINFRIVLDGARVQPTITAFPLEVMVTSSSTDTDKSDNVFYRNIDVRSKITMTPSSNADPEIFITKTEPDAKAEIMVQHSVTIVNDGPSNLLEPLTVKLHYPQATLGGQPVVQPTKIVLNVSDADENIVISCGSTGLTPEGSTNLSYRAFSVALDADSTADTEKNYDCRGSSGSCKSVLCEIGQVMASTFITLEFEYKVKQNLYTLVNGESSSVTETPVVTQVTSAIAEKPAIEFSSKPGAPITKMLPSKPIEKGVEAWVIIVPILIAIIIIAVIVFILYKRGFFVRKYRVQMEEAKKGEKAPLQSDMDVPDESATCEIVDDEQEQQKPLTTFTPPSEKKNIQNSKEEEEEKDVEPVQANGTQIMLNTDVSVDDIKLISENDTQADDETTKDSNGSVYLNINHSYDNEAVDLETNELDDTNTKEQNDAEAKVEQPVDKTVPKDEC